MICGYENTGCESQAERCPKCLTGIMVLVGIIGGIIFAAAEVILLLISPLSDPFAVILTFLVSGLVYLFVLLIFSFILKCESRFNSCIRCNAGGLFFGIFGTVFSSVLALSTSILSLSVLTAIFIGLSAFFFAFMIISTLFLIVCLFRC